jgi:hypothetical protein
MSIIRQRELMMKPPLLFSVIVILAFLSAHALAAGEDTRPGVPGDEKTRRTRLLEAGSNMLQTDAPPDRLDVHLVGPHPMKNDPAHQMDAHHFCQQMNEDFAQCALFDGDGDKARLTGIEYIISEKLFEGLPQDEQTYWHPHNYEILSGTLVAPRLPGAAEKALMRSKMNSYGKTWHVWNTGMAGRPGDALPLGEPQLAWSFNRDGEIDPALLKEREQRLGIDSRERRKARLELRDEARPQEGVDSLKGQFDRPTQELPGVRDKDGRFQK